MLASACRSGSWMVWKSRQVASQNITQKSPAEKFKVNLHFFFWEEVVTVFEGLVELEESIQQS